LIDLLVVGGGPIGLMSAIQAGSAGLSVTVVEPRSTPVDKACGEGLMPGAVAALAAVDVHPVGMPFGGIRYLQGDRQVEARFATGPGRGVRRTELHRALAARAEQLGVRFVEQRVTEVEQTAEWVGAAGVRARHLIGADGLHSTVRRAAGLQRPPGPIRRYGLRRHYRVVPWSDLVEVHWGPDAEVYVTPVAADTVGVAVLGRGPLDLDRTLSRLPALGQQLSGAAPVSDVRGAGPLWQRSRSRVSGRILLVGDAAGYVDALTGEGLRIGFAEAAAAVDCILKDRVDDYERRWHTLTRSYRVLTGSLVWCAGQSSVRRAIVPSARSLPPVFARLVNSLAT
jgi:flavin-dependent dehydrogenase